MAIRPINGNWNDFLITLNPLILKEFQENKAGLNTLKAAIEFQPTLTPPNDPTVCVGCTFESSDRDDYPCTVCKRNPALVDKYEVDSNG